MRPASLRKGYASTMPKYVVFYESADDVRSKAPAHFPAHRARWREFAVRGELLMIGTFANPQEEGAITIAGFGFATVLMQRRDVGA